jgi:crotonobetainyl-CoA:carnitine CoA-transferase CaiB-like acyl-CoA transferase
MIAVSTTAPPAAAGTLPLTGLLVLELGSSIAGAYCGKLMAAFGADVVKIEEPSGDPVRRRGPFAGDQPDRERGLLHLYLDTGKRSVTLAVGEPTGRDLLAGLIARADVVLNGGPAGLELAALTDRQVSELNPAAVLAHVTAFGREGPYVDYLDTDLVLLALGGLLSLLGHPGKPPVRLGGQQAYYQTGLAALNGILTALFVRDHDGHGQVVEVAAQEVIAFTEWKSAVYYQANHRRRTRGGLDSQWIVVRCQDGFLGFVYRIQNWPQILELIGDPELAGERFATRALQIRNREAMRAIIERWTSARKKSDVYHSAQALGIPVGMVADMADIVASDQYRYRAFLEPVDHPATGAASYPATPAEFNGVRPRTGRAPLLGEHNETVLCGLLGVSPPDLRRLHERGVL